MFLNWFVRRPRMRYDKSSSFLRVVLMMFLFAGMCWAFWANSQRYTLQFSASSRFQDELQAFTPEQEKEVLQIIANFKRNVTLKLTVKTRNTIFTSTEAIEGEVFFGIAPKQKQVVIFMPEIWRHALGEGFVPYIINEIMEPSFEDGTWPEASLKALRLMEQRFSALAK